VKVSTEKFRSRVTEYLPDIRLEDHIASYPDFPKPGILFRDISPLLAYPEALRYASFEMAKAAKDADVIAGLDARGFIFATRVAEILDKPFVMVRKKGKLPGETVGTDYSLEYGNNSIEIQKDAIKPGAKVALIDDLLAT
jgi:adenine phosphoribosyltransferase